MQADLKFLTTELGALIVYHMLSNSQERDGFIVKYIFFVSPS